MNTITKPYHAALDDSRPVHGTEKAWWPTDTAERYTEMMQDPVHREYFAKHGWDQPGAITYCFNSLGFRDYSTSADFTSDDDNLVALGCSFTMGIGLPWKSIWPTLLGQELNLRVCNFGWGGASADQCYRYAEYWIPELKPRLVVLLNPPRGRMELLVDEATGRAKPIWSHDTDHDPFVKQWLSVDANARLNNRKNSGAIGAICHQLGIPFLTYEADEWMSRSREIAGYARDYFHAGPEGHKTFTDRIIDDWRKKRFA